jgi:thiamine-phosphate pyrophosphorylase
LLLAYYDILISPIHSFFSTMSEPNSLQPCVQRILDANLDRSREGLRIIEEWCRFGLNNSQLSQECKNLRQELASFHSPEIRAARNTAGDVGTELSHPQEEQRQSIEQLLVANFSRIQEALRVLEEYSKLSAGPMSAACKQLRYRVYRLESAMTETDRLGLLAATRLYFVTMPVPNLLGVVEKALQGGLKLLQFRDKDGDDAQRLQQAKQLRELCHRYGALFILNDRVDLALAADADGVHLGQNDVPIALARQILGPQKIVGRSTTNPTEMNMALREGADYIGVGPVYETPTKAGKIPAGLDYVRYAKKHATVPWFAIGGIDHQNIGDVIESGGKSVAVVRAIAQSEQPTLAVQYFINRLSQPLVEPIANSNNNQPPQPTEPTLPPKDRPRIPFRP